MGMLLKDVTTVHLLHCLSLDPLLNIFQAQNYRVDRTMCLPPPQQNSRGQLASIVVFRIFYLLINH